ncbi:hypothetical protein ACWD62_44140 [Streptomyces sp. NPDC005146]
MVSVIAVLAFFGITNFDDLKNAGASDRSQACSTAIAARDAEGIVPADELPAKMDRYAQRLLEAANATDDKELRASLREAAYASQAYGNSIQANVASRTKAAFLRAQTAQNKWTSFCEEDDS